MEVGVVQTTQETLKLIEDSWAIKWAHIAELEATQDRSISDSAEALLQKQIDTRLAFIRLTLKDKEDWCSVNWFVALHRLQQLTFLLRLLPAQSSLCLNFRRSLRLVRLRRWVCQRSILQRHRQQPLCLCRLQPVRLLRHLTADLVRLSSINSWRHCWECSFAGSRRKQQWNPSRLYWPQHGQTRSWRNQASGCVSWW